MDTQLTRLAALGEPIRRLLYRFVATQPEPVSRDQAAEGIGIARRVAKFQLDKLADDGLLPTHCQRVSEVYRGAHDEIVASLPERHYDLAADILAQAVTAAQQSDPPIGEAIHPAARQTGARLGHSDTDRNGDERSGSAATIPVLLTAHGYEPVATPSSEDQTQVTLRNCPFRQLAEVHTDLVCGLNLDLLAGLLDNHPSSGLSAHLDPGLRRCPSP